MVVDNGEGVMLVLPKYGEESKNSEAENKSS